MSDFTVVAIQDAMNYHTRKLQDDPLREVSIQLGVLKLAMDSNIQLAQRMHTFYRTEKNNCAARECEIAETMYEDALRHIVIAQEKLAQARQR